MYNKQDKMLIGSRVCLITVSMYKHKIFIEHALNQLLSVEVEKWIELRRQCALINRIKILIIVGLCFLNSLGINANILYEYKEENELIKGVTHSYMDRITEKGMQKIHIAKVDLNNEGFDLRLLTSGDGSGIRDSLLKLCIDNNAILGINGDFFQINRDSRLTSPNGIEVDEGQLVSTPQNGNKMAAFGVYNERTTYFGYFNFAGTISTGNGATHPIAHKNKFYDQGGLVVYDRNWGNQSPGYPLTVFEMVVENDRVVALRSKDSPTEIPENGYVVASTGDNVTFLQDNFSFYDQVNISFQLDPHIDYLKTAISGGTFLVRDGQIAPVTHDVPGVHPRTAIGVDASGKVVMLVTVDGRTAASYGMTLSELAQFMQSLGCRYAINLDGGGSTTFVSSQPGNPQPQLSNIPSDGPMRLISNGIGVVPTFLGDIVDLHMATHPIYKDTENPINIVGLDQNKNIVPLDSEHLFISTDDGYISDGMLYPTREGKISLFVSYYDIYDDVEVTVLPNPSLPDSIEHPPTQHDPSQNIAILGPRVDETLLEGYMAGLAADEMSKNAFMSFYLDDNSYGIFPVETTAIREVIIEESQETEDIEPQIATYIEQQSYTKKTTIIKLDIEDTNTWVRYGNQLNSPQIGEGDIIFLSKLRPQSSPYYDLLIRILTNKAVSNGHKVFYISCGNVDTFEIKNGIRYITLAGTKGVTTEKSTLYDASYLLVTLDDEISYYKRGILNE